MTITLPEEIGQVIDFNYFSIIQKALHISVIKIIINFWIFLKKIQLISFLNKIDHPQAFRIRLLAIVPFTFRTIQRLR